MPRAKRVCSCLGCPAHEGSCPELADTGRCPRCRAAAEQRRGSARQRGYDHRHEKAFREGVLTAMPLCVCVDQTRTTTHHHVGQCLAPSTVADHHPRDRRELVRLGLDANDPKHGRGLCATCHNHWTALSSPGGWAAR